MILVRLPYSSKVGVVPNYTDYRVLTYVVDSPSCSISLFGYIAEVGKNWHDAINTFLVSAKKGHRSS